MSSLSLPTGRDENLYPLDPEPHTLAERLRRQQKTVAHLRHCLARDPRELERTHLGRELARMAECLALSACHPQALQAREEVLDIWQGLGRKRATFLARLRRAEALEALGKREDAAQELQALWDLQDHETALYADFVREAQALLLWRLGQGPQALAAMQHVLTLRRQRGHARHIHQTQEMLAWMQARLQGS